MSGRHEKETSGLLTAQVRASFGQRLVVVFPGIYTANCEEDDVLCALYVLMIPSTQDGSQRPALPFVAAARSTNHRVMSDIDYGSGQSPPPVKCLYQKASSPSQNGEPSPKLFATYQVPRLFFLLAICCGALHMTLSLIARVCFHKSHLLKIPVQGKSFKASGCVGGALGREDKGTNGSPAAVDEGDCTQIMYIPCQSISRTRKSWHGQRRFQIASRGRSSSAPEV